MPATAPGHPSAAALAAFALGKLDAPAAETVQDHLAGCLDCRTVVETTPHDTLLGLLQGRPGDTSPPASSVQAGTLSLRNPDLDLADLPAELRDHPRYRIVRKLGEGGMGAVYQAEHKIMERTVAVKVIASGLVDSPDAVERFQREVRSAAKLEHPNIVRAYDADTAGRTMLLAMEFVPGRSLADVVRSKGPLPVAHACHYVRQAALGLQHAADQGMVHRDIKPQNLMLTNKGVVKILDFGLAKLVSERASRAGLTGTNMVMGTPDYMAPEQARNTAGADIRADIYALGCTLFCLLTGRPPFHGGTAIELLTRHVTDAPPRVTEVRADVPDELAGLLDRMLAKDPAGRPQTPRQVAKALAAFTKAGGKTPPPMPAGSVFAEPPRGTMNEPRPRTPGRRWQWPAAVGVLAAAMVAAAVIWVKTSAGYVRLEVTPDDAEVRVDGELITVKPYRITVHATDRQLVVSKEGFQSRSESVSLKDNGRTIVATLVPMPPTAGPRTPEPPVARPEPVMIWVRESYVDGRWRPQQDQWLYANGKAKQPDSAITWSLKGNVLTVIGEKGQFIDRTFVSDDGRRYAGANQLGVPLRGVLKLPPPGPGATGLPNAAAGGAASGPSELPASAKPELIMVWKHEVYEGARWMPRFDVLQFSNGKVGKPDSAATWAMNGHTLTLDWSPNKPNHPTDRLIVSDDGQDYAGTNQVGIPIRGTLRWKKPPNAAETAPSKHELMMIWSHEVREGATWTPRSDILLFLDGTINSSYSWTRKGNVLTVTGPNGEMRHRSTISDDGQSFAGKNSAGQAVRGKLRWKKE